MVWQIARQQLTFHSYFPKSQHEIETHLCWHSETQSTNSCHYIPSSSLLDTNDRLDWDNYEREKMWIISPSYSAWCKAWPLWDCDTVQLSWQAGQDRWQNFTYFQNIIFCVTLCYAVESAGVTVWLCAHWTVWRHCNPPGPQSRLVCYQHRNIKTLPPHTMTMTRQLVDLKLTRWETRHVTDHDLCWLLSTL